MSGPRIGNSIDLPPMPLPPELPPDPQPATLDDVVPLLSRIADALERLAPTPETECGENRDGVLCRLDAGHVGYHVSADGNLQWLDDQPTQVRGPERI